jgi:hypothetical protein
VINSKLLAIKEPRGVYGWVIKTIDYTAPPAPWLQIGRGLVNGPRLGIHPEERRGRKPAARTTG